MLDVVTTAVVSVVVVLLVFEAVRAVRRRASRRVPQDDFERNLARALAEGRRKQRELGRSEELRAQDDETDP